jgi:RNA polymerase sigma factor (sigma-70 family)
VKTDERGAAGGASGDTAPAEAAVTSLYRQHAVGLIRLAVIMLGDRQAAEDVVQEAFCGLYRRWEHLTDTGKALGYVRSAILNGCRSELRSRIRSERRAPPRDGEPASPESVALLGEEHREVLAALRRLPDRQREALVLRFYLELTEPQIAAALTVPGSVYRVAADSTGNGTERFYAAVITHQGPVRFYRITRRAGGATATVTALPIPATSGRISYLAVSPDGRQLAWATYVTHGSTSYVQGLTVASTATGTERRWTAPRASDGSLASLSWLGDNRTLAFSWGFDDNSPAGSLRLLDTTAAGTRLLSGRSVLALSNRAGRFADLVISNDGQVLVGTLSSPRGPFGTVAGQRTALGDVIEFAARTGRARFLYRPAAKPGRGGVTFCDDPLWMSIDGRGVLLACDRSSPDGGDHVSIFLLDGARPVSFPQLVPFVKAQDELEFSG